MSDNLMLYKYFIVAAEEKSITAAAKKLYVSQPAVSAGIAKLEDSLSTALFFRTNKGIELTGEGKMLYDYVKRAFSFIEAGEDKLREIAGLREGVLRIGASDMTLKFALFDLIRNFKNEHPGIRLVISNNPTPKTMSQLKAGMIDFCAVSSPISEDSEFAVIPIKKVRDIFVCSPDYKVKDELTFDELTKERLIMLDKETSSRRYVEEFITESCGHSFEPDIELATSDLLIETAMRGFGISAIVEDFVKDKIEKGILKEVRTKKEIPLRELLIVYLKDIQLSAGAREFLKLVTNAYGKA